MLVGAATFNIIYNRFYLKKMKAAVQLLEANCAEEYITKVESMRHHAKGRFAKSMLTINLSAGYLCLCYFYQKQTDRALTLYESSQRIFNSYRNSKLYGGNIAVLDIYAAIGVKDYARAANLLQTARSTWNDPHFIDDYHYLEENIHQLQAD